MAQKLTDNAIAKNEWIKSALAAIMDFLASKDADVLRPFFDVRNDPDARKNMKWLRFNDGFTLCFARRFRESKKRTDNLPTIINALKQIDSVRYGDFTGM